MKIQTLVYSLFLSLERELDFILIVTKMKNLLLRILEFLPINIG